MYAFLVVVSILLPNGESHKFNISSRGQFSRDVCVIRAERIAERARERATKAMRIARVTTEATCEMKITRPT